MTILHRSESTSVAPRSHASISIHFLPFPAKMMDEHRNINQSNLHNNMSTKDPIKAAVEEVWNLLLLGNFWKIAIMMCVIVISKETSQSSKWFSGFIWCVMILIYSFYLCAEAWWHTRFLLSTSVFLHSSHLKLSVCCAFLCRSMIKCFPAFITCALLAPFDVVFIVFLPFELSATCFALALFFPHFFNCHFENKKCLQDSQYILFTFVSYY